MTIISTLNAAKQVARNDKQDYAATSMGTLGNLKFKLTGGTMARRPEGLFGRLGTGLKALKMVLFSSSSQRAQIRDQGQELRAMKRCGHLYGKLTADLTEPRNVASVAKTLARMGASVPQDQGAKQAWGKMLEKTLDLVTDQDRQDILDGVLVMRNADVEPGGVALSHASMMILDHIARTLMNAGGARSAGQADATAAVTNTVADGKAHEVPGVKLTVTDSGSPLTPSKPSPLSLSESAVTPPPIPPSPPGFVATPHMKPAGPSPAIPPRPAGHASASTVKSAEAKPSGAETVLPKPVPSRKSRVADIVKQIAEAALKEQEKAAASRIKTPGVAPRASVSATSVRVK